MLLEGRARYLVGGVIRRDLDERCPAQLGGKARPQRDDFHRRPPFRVCSTFPPNRPAGNAVGGETPSGGMWARGSTLGYTATCGHYWLQPFSVSSNPSNKR